MSDEMSQIEGMPEGQTECQEISQKEFLFRDAQKECQKECLLRGQNVRKNVGRC